MKFSLSAVVLVLFSQILIAEPAPSWDEYLRTHVSATPIQTYLKLAPSYWRVTRDDVLSVLRGERPRLAFESRLALAGREDDPGRLYDVLRSYSKESPSLADQERNDHLSRAIRYLALSTPQDQMTFIVTGKTHSLDAFADGPEIPLGYLGQALVRELRTGNPSYWNILEALDLTARRGNRVTLGKSALVRDYGRDESAAILFPLARIAHHAERGAPAKAEHWLDKPPVRTNTLVLGEIHRVDDDRVVKALPTAAALKAAGFTKVRVAMEFDRLPMLAGGYTRANVETTLGEVLSPRTTLHAIARRLGNAWEEREKRIQDRGKAADAPLLEEARREKDRHRALERQILEAPEPVEVPVVRSLLEAARAWSEAGIVVTYQGIDVGNPQTYRHLIGYFEQYARVLDRRRHLMPGQSRGDSPSELLRDLQAEERRLRALETL